MTARGVSAAQTSAVTSVVHHDDFIGAPGLPDPRLQAGGEHFSFLREGTMTGIVAIVP
ncbi:hypothetical protein [Arthrobacter sp. UYCu723]